MIESKTSDGLMAQEINSVVEFKPFLTLNEEGYFVPNGVYCPGKNSVKELPKLPKSFSFSLSEVQPLTGSGSELGTIDYQYVSCNIFIIAMYKPKFKYGLLIGRIRLQL